MKDGTRKTEEFRAGIYTVSVYPSESERAPVVYLPDIAEGGEELISSCRKLDSPPFTWSRCISATGTGHSRPGRRALRE